MVFSIKMGVQKLTDLGGREKDELVREVQGWGEDEAVAKGKGLWETSVLGYCTGGVLAREDVTVVGGEA